MDINRLLELVGKLIEQSGEAMDVITSELAWEKWFQCNLYAWLRLNNVDVYCEACMDDSQSSAGLRPDFMILDNTGQTVTLMELKCASPNMPGKKAITGFFADMGKLETAFAPYNKLCILVIPSVKFQNCGQFLDSMLKKKGNSVWNFGHNSDNEKYKIIIAYTGAIGN